MTRSLSLLLVLAFPTLSYAQNGKPVAKNSPMPISVPLENQTFKCEVGQQLVITFTATTPLTFWGLDEEPNISVYQDSNGKTLVVNPRAQGLYKFAVNTVIDGAATKPITCRIEAVKNGGSSVRPPVAGPPKKTAGKITVVIVRKAGDAAEKILSDLDFAAEVRELGHVLLPVTVGSDEASQFQKLVDDLGTPVLVLVAPNGQVLRSGRLPASTDAIIDQIRGAMK